MDVDIDRVMMMHCIALSKASGEAGEYPYGAVVCRKGTIVADSTNMVTHDGDVTRHAEVVAISRAQKSLGTVSLDDCEIYVNAEPCAMCSLAIRESRIRRVVYGLSSPHMGGVSKWTILGDNDISNVIPEVFAPPPEFVSGYMAEEAERALARPIHGSYRCDDAQRAGVRDRGVFFTAAGAGLLERAGGLRDVARRGVSAPWVMVRRAAGRWRSCETVWLRGRRRRRPDGRARRFR